MREQVLPIKRAPKPPPARPWRSGFCSGGAVNHVKCRGVFVGASAGKDAVCACECHTATGHQGDAVALRPDATGAQAPTADGGSVERGAGRTPSAAPPHQTSEAGCAPIPPPVESPASEPDLTPGSPEWSRRITASKVAAILGVSPWESPRSVWHSMRGDLPREEANDAMRRGNYLEPAILAWWRDQHGINDLDDWEEQPVYTLGDWAAATPDAFVHCFISGEEALVEAKSAARDDDWGDPGTEEIPPYYLVQVQWQMHVSGVHLCYVPVLTSRLRFVEYVVPYYAEYGPELEQRMRAFYDSLSADEPPPLDDTVATYDAIRKVHKDIERGESVELTDVEAMSLLMNVERHKEFEGHARHWKAHTLDRMGRAQYATHNGVRIARRQPRGDDVTFVVLAKPADLTEEPA